MRNSALVLVILAFAMADAGDNDAVMDSVREVIAELNESIGLAYTELLEGDPEASGTITLAFRIMPDGAIWDLSVEADSVLLPLAPLIDSLLREETVELTEPIQVPVPVTVPIQLTPAE